jgi:uncharacterized SAM-dependent methyltransferase
MVAQHPGLTVCAVVSDFEDQVGAPEGDARRLVAFPGGTIGNLLPAQRATFLTSLRARLRVPAVHGQIEMLAIDAQPGMAVSGRGPDDYPQAPRPARMKPLPSCWPRLR